jgi:hypothetical protein
LQLDLESENKTRDLENLRKYQTRAKQSANVADVVPFIPIPKPNDTATTATPTPATDAPTGPSKLPKAGVAFRETDEAQLTDPEGLAPLEEDSGHSNNPLQFFAKPN